MFLIVVLALALGYAIYQNYYMPSAQVSQITQNGKKEGFWPGWRRGPGWWPGWRRGPGWWPGWRGGWRGRWPGYYGYNYPYGYYPYYYY